MSCIGNQARELIQSTGLLLKQGADPVATWKMFAKKAEGVIERFEALHTQIEVQRDDLADSVAELTESVREGRAGVEIVDRIVAGDMKLDDWCIAAKRNWPFERLEQLAGVRS